MVKVVGFNLIGNKASSIVPFSCWESGYGKRQAASALASLTISSKEIVETAISDYESKLKESDRSPYLKYKKLYEQELEK